MNSTGPEFDYQNQSITILVADGTSVNITLGYVDKIQIENIQYAIIFAVQLGACGLLMLLLAMLTKPDKRRAPLFFMNIISLVLIIARSVLQLQFLLGPWSTAYRFYAYDFSDIPMSAYVTSVATITLQLLLNICIQISLILQVRVVYSSTPKLNLYMTLISTAIALAYLGVYMKMVQENIDSVLNAANYTQITWTISKILFAFNICFFTSIFNFKLWMAIRRRKALGLPSFGPLQVIFIMGCQTMIIPGKLNHPIACEIYFILTLFLAIFSVLENIVTFDGMSSFTAMFVVISLPLSSMWASAQTDTPVPSSTATCKPSNHRSFPSKTSTLVTSSTMTACDGYRSDLESGNGGFGNTTTVRVDKSFAVDKSANVEFVG
ncbi:pheromone alpha factor receptor [Maublancomyces gigas]|uniref:Pheromone alpha factor receptor n=1 Tax=Discina gigas TaxID=1032678 RepID=A0ABR3GQV8_9PEZI